MRFVESIANIWNAVAAKVGPVFSKIGGFFKKVGSVLARVARYVMRFKKVILAVPVVWGAVWLALKNMSLLPDKVGLGLQIDGTFSMMLPKLIAVLGPVAVTALCLLLMFCSKRTLTPWLVSVFSLALPLLLLLINIYPS